MKPEEINELTKKLFRELSQPGCTVETLRRYLVESEGCCSRDAGALAELIRQKLDRERFPPITEMELMLTEDCNQRCHYCFVEGKNEFNRMPWGVAGNAVDYLIDHSADRKELKLLFFGGEPMLEFDLIRKIAPYARRQAKRKGKQVKFDMTSNGTLFDEERMKFLAGYGVNVLLSIDGDRETHDRHRRALDGKSSYEKVVGNLGILKKYQPWLGTRMTAHPDTVGRIYPNLLHLAALGINQFIIGPATGQGWTDGELDTYRDEMIRVASWLGEQLKAGRHFRVTTLEENLKMMGGKKSIWGCRAGRHSITVNARGEIHPCSKMLGVEKLRGIFRLGTLEKGITELYNRMALCGFVPAARESCRECPQIDRCMGGCYATNYQATGSIFQPDPFDCRLKKRTVEIAERAEKILGPKFYKKKVNRKQ